MEALEPDKDASDTAVSAWADSRLSSPSLVETVRVNSDATSASDDSLSGTSCASLFTVATDVSDWIWARVSPPKLKSTSVAASCPAVAA
jgi:hypothetical protein